MTVAIHSENRFELPPEYPSQENNGAPNQTILARGASILGGCFHLKRKITPRKAMNATGFVASAACTKYCADGLIDSAMDLGQLTGNQGDAFLFLTCTLLSLVATSAFFVSLISTRPRPHRSPDLPLYRPLAESGATITPFVEVRGAMPEAAPPAYSTLETAAESFTQNIVIRA